MVREKENWLCLNSTELRLFSTPVIQQCYSAESVKARKTFHLSVYLKLIFIWLNINLLNVAKIFFLLWPEICVWHFPFLCQRRRCKTEYRVLSNLKTSWMWNKLFFKNDVSYDTSFLCSFCLVCAFRTKENVYLLGQYHNPLTEWDPRKARHRELEERPFLNYAPGSERFSTPRPFGWVESPPDGTQPAAGTSHRRSQPRQHTRWR